MKINSRLCMHSNYRLQATRKSGVVSELFLQRLAVLLFFMFPADALAGAHGSVCLGPFLSVVWYEPSERPYLTIGDHGPFHFEQGGTQQPRLVAEDLDLNKVYRAKVHFGGKVVRSWDIDFRKMGVDMAYIWRAKGRMAHGAGQQRQVRKAGSPAIKTSSI